MRTTQHEWAMEIAQVTAMRSTCIRRSVGCVLLNSKGHLIASGFNGVASGQPHCNDAIKTEEIVNFGAVEKLTIYPHKCDGDHSKSGENLDLCQAIHAEQNALLQCKDVHDIDSCYVTTSPCPTCTKLLLNTSCRRIIFLDSYPGDIARDLWIKSGRIWAHVSEYNSVSDGSAPKMIQPNKY